MLALVFYWLGLYVASGFAFAVVLETISWLRTKKLGEFNEWVALVVAWPIVWIIILIGAIWLACIAVRDKK